MGARSRRADSRDCAAITDFARTPAVRRVGAFADAARAGTSRGARCSSAARAGPRGRSHEPPDVLHEPRRRSRGSPVERRAPRLASRGVVQGNHTPPQIRAPRRGPAGGLLPHGLAPGRGHLQRPRAPGASPARPRAPRESANPAASANPDDAPTRVPPGARGRQRSYPPCFATLRFSRGRRDVIRGASACTACAVWENRWHKDSTVPIAPSFLPL